jgi:hypothetical protein
MPVNMRHTLTESQYAAAMAMVPLTVVSSEQEAEVVCGLLRANGIECGTQTTGAAGALSAVLVSGGPTEIVVDERDVERARELLAAGS